MNAITAISAAVLTMSSREIAELTGRDHGNVMRDIRRKSDEYRSLAKRLWKEAELMNAKAEQLEKTGQELRDLADAWKRMFPDTQDCV